jgi:hypothetical protein
MKNIIFFISSFLILQYSTAQTAASFYKKADSLYKVKDYETAANVRGEAIRLEGNAVTIGKYWACACDWSLAGNADSAFYYLSIIKRSDKVTVQDIKQIEYDEDFNPIRSDKRWQPFIEAGFGKAISGTKVLAEQVRAGKRVNSSVDKYQIAIAWATAKNTDSVLFYINSIVNTDKNRYSDYEVISKEKIFSYLQNDPGWIALLDQVRKNTPKFVCEHRPRSQPVPMTLTIDDASEFLKSDGKGTYRNNEDKVRSYHLTAYNINLSGLEPLQASGNWTDASPRYFVLNLDKPVKKSGATRQGIITDHFACLHAFYKFDTTNKQNVIYTVNEMPVGASVENPRTEIEFFIKGKLHLLTFGYWAMGDCGEGYACGGKVNGAGTTLVKITRHTTTSYTIEASKGSIGRLWNIDNRTKPIDKGLFESGFIIHIEHQ